MILMYCLKVEGRKHAYSALPNVKVQPLRIAESDLDVSRIPTLMGADNLEVCLVVASSQKYLTKNHSSSERSPIYA